tara:strand:- start:791 stop:1261 length:471 start_codon:yes stop_codon:yes gene_type:complete
MTSIRGYENYVIFEDGVVINTETGKEMKPWLNKTNGYYKVSLSKNNKQRTNYNHRLIALAYIPNPDNKDFIDHINRIKTDNRIENLRWATHSENMQNKSEYKTNTSGTTNVYYDKKYDKWYYQKTKNGVKHSSPYYDTPEEAIEYKHNYEFVEPVL